MRPHPAAGGLKENTMTSNDRTHLNGRGIDQAKERRPGVPMEHSPEPLANAHWLTPDLQPPRDEVLRDLQHETLTATFGTSCPPRGLSGALRRAAYRIPDYRVRRWLLLVFADRVDALESRILAPFKSSTA
jgi:hypothetical protein